MVDCIQEVLPLEDLEPRQFHIGFTGSRELVAIPEDKRLAVFERTQEYVLEVVENLRSRGFDPVILTGMAEGWDEIAAVIAINNKIPYFAFLPNMGYGEYYWGRKSLTGTDRLERFQRLVSRADDVVVCSKSLYVNGRHSNFVRNDQMMAASDLVLAYDTGSSGTRDAITTARRLGKPVEVFPFK